MAAEHAPRTFSILLGFSLVFGCGRARSFDTNVDLSPPPPQRPPPVAAGASSSSAGPRVRPKASLNCARDASFPSPLDVPEASGAAEVELTAGTKELLVTSDSGGKGRALAWKIPGGPARIVTLPLDDAASDDLEGLAWHEGHVFALTSSGAMRRFTADEQGALRRDQDAYAIASPPLVCDDLRDGNCGKNYEGLCLRSAHKEGACDGYAASKTDGALYCLAFTDERLGIARTPLQLPLGKDVLSDCAFGPPGPAEDVLMVMTNLYGGSKAYVVDESTGDLSPIDVPPTLNGEVVAADGTGALYTMQDDNGQTSVAYRFTCTGWK